MSIWAKHVREKFPQVDDRYPDHVERFVSANMLCELVSPEAFFLLVRLCGASSARIQFSRVNASSNSAKFAFPSLRNKKRKFALLRITAIVAAVPRGHRPAVDLKGLTRKR